MREAPAPSRERLPPQEWRLHGITSFPTLKMLPDLDTGNPGSALLFLWTTDLTAKFQWRSESWWPPWSWKLHAL